MSARVVSPSGARPRGVRAARYMLVQWPDSTVSFQLRGVSFDEVSGLLVLLRTGWGQVRP